MVAVEAHARTLSHLDLPLRLCRKNVVHMTRVELIHERTADGTIVLRPVVLGPIERLRRLLRRLVPAT